MKILHAVVCVGDPGINALATIRSLGRRGIPVQAVALEGSAEIASASRYCTAVSCVADLGQLYGALCELSRKAGQTMLLCVDNDRMLKALAPHAAELKKRFRVVEPLERVEEMMDKAFQVRMAEQAGIHVPRTWFPASWEELLAVGGQTQRRLIAKPSPSRVSADAPATFKAEVAANAEDLAAVLRPLVSSAQDVMVQEYIEGDDSFVYGALAYRSKEGERCIVLSVRKHRQTVPGAGIMAVGQVVDVPEVRELTVRLLEKVDYRGIVHTEFKRCPDTGRYHFIEWNNRPGYFHSLGWKAGFDGPWLAYCDHVEPERLDAVKLRQDSGHYWITLSGDLMHLSKAPTLALRPSTWAPYLSGPEWAVFDLSDVGPWVKSSRDLARWVWARARGRAGRAFRTLALRPA